LVINALRFDSHPSHMNVEEALEVIRRVNPKRAYLTHISHHLGKHADVQPTLAEGVQLAYDGLSITI
jgi:phosphoribosyl 1,2-cyclic phosphate phosphodiesterase